MREGALALTCLSCVIGARATCPRITDDGTRARTSTGPGARSSRRRRPENGILLATCCRRGSLLMLAAAAPLWAIDDDGPSTIYLALRVEAVRLSPTD